MKLTKGGKGTETGGSQVYFSATYIPIRSYRFLLPFFRNSARVEKQARASAGLIEYQLQADPLNRRFWTVSLWTDPNLMADFVKTDPHSTTVRLFPEWAADGYGSTRWIADHAKIDWREVERHLREAGASEA